MTGRVIPRRPQRRGRAPGNPRQRVAPATKALPGWGARCGS